MSVMSWDVREEADYYVARAVSAAGEYQLCNSNNTVCSIPALDCGETFTFTVTAHRGHCQSDVSTPVYLTTGAALYSVQKSHLGSLIRKLLLLMMMMLLLIMIIKKYFNNNLTCILLLLLIIVNSSYLFIFIICFYLTIIIIIDNILYK